MAQTIRVSVDCVVKKGDPARIVQALNKKDHRKTAADHVAHVLAVNAIEGVELEPVGGYVHLHDHDSTGQCSIDVKESAAYLPDFD